jgi:hypothetical protein
MVPSWAAETIRARRLLPAAARPWRRFPRRSSRAHLWTWGGSDFGYRDGDELWTYDGRHVGRFQGQNVFGIDGQYLGELRGDDRLITRTTNPPRPRRAFTPLPARPARPRYRGFSSFEAVKGFADFPAPETL